MSKSANDIIRISQAVVRERLHSRATPVQGQEPWASVPAELSARAQRILTVFHDHLKLEVEKMRATEQLRDVFRVSEIEMPEVSHADMARAKLRDFVVAFPYDIMFEVERLGDRKLWRRAQMSLAKPPNNEEEWIEVFMGMTVGEFLTFVANMMLP